MIDGFAHESPSRRALLVLLTWTWCLPTTLVGLVAGLVTLAFLGGTRASYRGATVIRSPSLRALGGVCLGPVILVTDTASDELVAHEWGHFRQHLRLGPLYLLVIGIPSATHAAWHTLRRGGFPDYYHYWTEAWADHLAGIYPRHAHLHRHWTGYALGPIVTVVALGLTARAFGHALGFPFTDADALVDVAWAAHPLGDQLLVPLTGGLGGDNANFWRPAAMFQFWGLRRLFDESPAGWHAWSLATHVVATVLVGLLLEAVTRVLGRADRRVALVGAVLFCVHPLAEEIVPATARSLDLLLAVGFFGALLALVRVVEAHGRAPIATALFYGFSALALASKEAGVLLLPVGAAWIGLLGGSRRTAARLLVPLAVYTVGFLLVRAWVLDGLGGYRDSDSLGDTGLFGYALSRGFLEPLLPSLSGVLRPLEGAAGTVFTLAVWAALLVPLRRHARFLALLGAVYVPWVLLLGLTGTYSRRVLYVPTIAIAAVLALAAVELYTWFSASGSWGGALPRNAPPGGARPLDPPGRGGRAVLSAVTIGLYAAFLHGSPALVRYDDWGVSGRVVQPLLDPVAWAAFPDNATVWLVDRPSRVDVDPRRFRLWSRKKSLNNVAASYSIAAWVRGHVGRGLVVRSLAATVLDGGSRAEGEISGGDKLVVTRPGVVRQVKRAAGIEAVEAGDALRIALRGGEGSPGTNDPVAAAWLLVWGPDVATPVRLDSAGATLLGGR